MDVLAIGPVVERVSRDFDRYWASQSAYPADRLLSGADEEDLDAMAADLASVQQDAEARRFVAALQNSEFLRELLDREVSFVWAPVEMVSDDPAKAQGLEGEQGLLSQQLALALGEPEKTVTLVSPYFVPGNRGVELFRELESAGVQEVRGGYRRKQEPRAGSGEVERDRVGRADRPGDGGRVAEEIVGRAVRAKQGQE